MLDERGIEHALFFELRRTLLHFSNPFRRWLNGKMRCIEGEVEKEGLLLLGALAEVIRRPAREDVRRMAFGVDDLRIAAHVVAPLAQVRGVAVHHVTEEAVEEVKAALIRSVGGVETEMPFANHRRVITDLLQFIANRRNAGCEVTP